MPSFAVSSESIISDINWIANTPSLLIVSHLNEVDIQPLTENQIQRIFQLGPFEFKSKKLGYYFEELLKIWIQVNEQYTLKVANLQVQKDRQTQGEYDFILENVEREVFEHWEVSCKFYLCHKPEKGLKGCSGTQLQDVFQQKVDKLKNQQLKLSETANGKATLTQIGVKSPESHGMLKGMLFFNRQIGGFQNEWFNPFARKGIWMYFSEWDKHQAGDYVILKKPFLFSLNSYSTEEVYGSNQIALEFKNKQPFMLAEVDSRKDQLVENKRIWMIPDGWF